MLRIISQDGLLDVPYEGNVVKILKNKANGKGLVFCGEHIVAEYENVDVAESYVKKLREQYHTNMCASMGVINGSHFKPYFQFY